MKIIFDCDPGHDDIFALCALLAHPERFDLLGCTTVAGNQTVEKVTDNLLRVLSYLHRKVDVSIGAPCSLDGRTFVQPVAHGESGMDGPMLPESTLSVTGVDAVEWIHQTILEQSSPVTIVATGPLTNIANLLSHYPSIKNRVERIAMMGGSLYSGNITSQAEFNIYVDPQAAKVVFASGIPITMSGLEVCHQAMILHSEIERFNTDGKASTLTFELLEFYSRFAKHLGQPGSPLFDLCPVVELLYPHLFTSVDLFVDVETQGELTRGKTVGDVRGWADKSKVNAKVLIDVDRQAFIDVFVENARILDREG